jgi:hypothetical protein
MRTITLALVALFFIFQAPAHAQATGDTIVVQAFNYNSTTRDSIISFPTDPSLEFEKIIMLYSMRCKDGLVSTGTNRNRGCGEWDYSCNTYITDSSHVDSVTAKHPDYSVSGYSGSSYNYVTQATYNMYQDEQQNVVLNSITSEDTAILGNGNQSLTNVVNTSQTAGKHQFLLTQSELLSAGLTTGNIDALALNVSNNPAQARYFRIRLKSTAKTSLDAADPDLSGFTEVYYKNTNFSQGVNRFQFYTPFNWNGTSNIMVELSFTNKFNGTSMAFAGDTVAQSTSIYSAGDMQFDFNGSSYLIANAYKGITGDTTRTIEAWIKTTGSDLDIVYYGSNSAGKKYRFWVNGNGQLRTEVNSGSAVGTTPVNDGQWHHVAMVQSGSSTNQIAFYIDGVQDAVSSVTNHPINTQANWLVRIGQSIHNKPFVGQIADVRMWKTALSQSTIDDWRFKKLDASHPDNANLELHYPLNDNNGTTITDQSPNARNASVSNGVQWSFLYGIDHFKGWQSESNRPNLALYQGTYSLTVSPDTVIDSVARHPNLVTQYQVYPKTGTLQADSIGATQQNTYWQAIADSLFDPQGNLVSVFNNPPDGSITIGDLTYWRRFPSKFEIMSFVTPYGIGIDFGMDGHTWAFDLTDFSPILKGNKRISMERGGQWQEDMDIKFLFVLGTPPRDVLDIQQIWRVGYDSYTRITSDLVYEPRDVPLDASADGFKIRSAITGHGQEGEFIPRNHFVNLDGGSPDFTWQVWKECAMNPVYPQGGTWIYDRAGWCPGMATDLVENEITFLVNPGQSVNIDYGMSGASGTSNYIVNHQLVTYGPPNFTLDAAVKEIINPTNRIEYQRAASICEGPIVKIQNTGSALLTSLKITYWTNNNVNKEIYNWSGTLGFLESEDVVLPVGDLWEGLSGTANNRLHVSIAEPNGGMDAYSYNNKMHTDFSLPEVFPNEIYFAFRTNNAAQENSYTVRDASGNVVFSKSGFSSNDLYYDTLNLADGCYTLQLDDTDDDGIAFWANNDGNGWFRIFDAQTLTRIYTLEPDFGRSAVVAFTVNYPLSFEELHPEIGLNLFPNPSTGKFSVQAKGNDAADTWQIHVSTVDGKTLLLKQFPPAIHLDETIDLADASPGMYFVKVTNGRKAWVEKLIVD